MIPIVELCAPSAQAVSGAAVEERKSANVERFLSVVERYTEIPELTPCILHEFIEKIVVHAASDPKGKNRTQEIDIYYKGIGALEVSKVTSSRQE